MMGRRLYFPLTLLLLSLPALAQLSDPIPVRVSGRFDFVVFGDIRFTDPDNTKVSNPAARRAIEARIAALKPAFVLMTGDLVLKGGNRRDWQIWDAETRSLREARVPVFPVPGNHDLSGDPKLMNFFQRFPPLKQRPWYAVRAGSVVCFMLNSAVDAPGSEQWRWLDQQMLQLPADVDFLLFVLHHPPYTRSSTRLFGGGHAARPVEQQLAAILERRQRTMRQRMVVIAGHVHNYERYEHGGITYIVSGGGGATPYQIPRSPGDAYREPGPTYHLVRFFVTRGQLRGEMNKLEFEQGQAKWLVKDSFLITAPKLPKAASAQ